MVVQLAGLSRGVSACSPSYRRVGLLRHGRPRPLLASANRFRASGDAAASIEFVMRASALDTLRLRRVISEANSARPSWHVAVPASNAAICSAASRARSSRPHRVPLWRRISRSAMRHWWCRDAVPPVDPGRWPAPACRPTLARSTPRPHRASAGRDQQRVAALQFFFRGATNKAAPEKRQNVFFEHRRLPV